jgi:uncharacterized protein with von Willebrand factor type A (vWA) domain
VDREDLLRMLDLSGKERPPPEKTSVIASASTASKPTTPASPTALVLDGWALRRGKELLEGSPLIQGLKLSEEAIADFHAVAFLPDHELVEVCRDPARLRFLAQLLGTRDFRALHAATMLREDASEVAAAAFAEQFASLRQDEEIGPGGEEGEEGGSSEESTDRAGEMAALRAAGKALSRASEEVGAMSEAAGALGLGPGSPGSNDPRAVAALFRRVRNDFALRRICEMAGRFRRLAQSRQRMKTSHGVDEVAGVELGGDLARLLPVELARIALPELELDTLRRLAERQCMQRFVRGAEPVGRGPVLVAVDESGSMQGDKAHTAKALALAVAWVARRRRRWCALVAYSGNSGERLLALPPGRWDELALCEWLSAFIGKGSSIDVPVRELPRMYEQLRAPHGRTDVLFLTDAQAILPPVVVADFLAWKARARARLITLVVQGEPGDLAKISDECHSVPALSPSEDAVGRALSF